MALPEESLPPDVSSGSVRAGCLFRPETGAYPPDKILNARSAVGAGPYVLKMLLIYLSGLLYCNVRDSGDTDGPERPGS